MGAVGGAVLMEMVVVEVEGEDCMEGSNRFSGREDTPSTPGDEGGEMLSKDRNKRRLGRI